MENNEKSKKRKSLVGQTFLLRCGVVVTIVADFPDSGYRAIVADNNGRSKEVALNALRIGAVSWRWDDAGNPLKCRGVTPTCHVGDTHILKCGTKIEVLEYLGARNVIVSDEAGNTKRISAASLKRGSLIWEFNKPVKEQKPPRPKSGPKVRYPSGHYVYLAVHAGDVIYVGKGQGQRAAHVNSGRSNNIELNRLHFSGEEVTLQYYATGLTNEQAKAIEAELIFKFKPKCNVYCKKP